MGTTLNGWPKDPSTVRIYIGNDTDGCEVRAGDVAKAFEWLGKEFHAKVEPVRVANGYRSSSFNASIGGVGNSNHVSATAIDLNGRDHPYEKHQPPGAAYTTGFNAKETAAIRAILAKAKIFTWGADFNRGYRDAMHFEIKSGTSAAEVHAFVVSITPKPKPKPKPLEDTLPSAVTKTTSLDQPLTPKTWKTLVLKVVGSGKDVQHQTSLLASSKPLRFDTTLHITAKGLPVGHVLKVRAVRVKVAGGKTTVVKEYPIVEVDGTTGGTFRMASWKGDTNAKDRLRFQVVTDDSGVSIDTVSATAHYWVR